MAKTRKTIQLNLPATNGRKSILHSPIGGLKYVETGKNTQAKPFR